MSLTSREDREVVTAAALEFMKICERHGLSPENIVHVTIAVGASALQAIAEGNRAYLEKLLSQYQRSFETAVFVGE